MGEERRSSSRTQRAKARRQARAATAARARCWSGWSAAGIGTSRTPRMHEAEGGAARPALRLSPARYRPTWDRIRRRSARSSRRRGSRLRRPQRYTSRLSRQIIAHLDALVPTTPGDRRRQYRRLRAAAVASATTPTSGGSPKAFRAELPRRDADPVLQLRRRRRRLGGVRYALLEHRRRSCSASAIPAPSRHRARRRLGGALWRRARLTATRSIDAPPGADGR